MSTPKAPIVVYRVACESCAHPISARSPESVLVAAADHRSYVQAQDAARVSL